MITRCFINAHNYRLGTYLTNFNIDKKFIYRPSIDFDDIIKHEFASKDVENKKKYENVSDLVICAWNRSRVETHAKFQPIFPNVTAVGGSVDRYRTYDASIVVTNIRYSFITESLSLLELMEEDFITDAKYGLDIVAYFLIPECKEFDFQDITEVSGNTVIPLYDTTSKPGDYIMFRFKETETSHPRNIEQQFYMVGDIYNNYMELRDMNDKPVPYIKGNYQGKYILHQAYEGKVSIEALEVSDVQMLRDNIFNLPVTIKIKYPLIRFKQSMDTIRTIKISKFVSGEYYIVGQQDVVGSNNNFNIVR